MDTASAARAAGVQLSEETLAYVKKHPQHPKAPVAVKRKRKKKPRKPSMTSSVDARKAGGKTGKNTGLYLRLPNGEIDHDRIPRAHCTSKHCKLECCKVCFCLFVCLMALVASTCVAGCWRLAVCFVCVCPSTQRITCSSTHVLHTGH